MSVEHTLKERKGGGKEGEGAELGKGRSLKELSAARAKISGVTRPLVIALTQYLFTMFTMPIVSDVIAFSCSEEGTAHKLEGEIVVNAKRFTYAVRLGDTRSREGLEGATDALVCGLGITAARMLGLSKVVRGKHTLTSLIMT